MKPAQMLKAGLERIPSQPARYLLAILITFVAILLHLSVSPYLPPSVHLFFYPAVVLSAWLVGFGPAAVSVAGSMMMIAYLFRSPAQAIPIDTARDALDLSIFGIVSLGLAWLTARTRKATRRAAAAQRQAEAAAAAKDQVLAIVSHDLKNPLHTIALSADHIQAPVSRAEYPRIEEYAPRIRRAADRAAHLVAELLDASKIEAGALRLDVSRWPVESLLEDAVSQFVPIAEARGVRLDLSLGTKSWIYCDGERLLQVLSNVLGNAVQYVAPGGEVRVSLDKTDRGVRLVVSDSGPGMTPEQLRHVFEPYWRGRTDPGGTGLGLFISREVVREHGGQLEIVSDEKRGTTISVVLPQPVAPAAEREGVFARPAATER